MIASQFADTLNRVADICPQVDVAEQDRDRVLVAIHRLEIQLDNLTVRLGVNGTPVDLPPTTPVPPPPPPPPEERLS